MAIISCKKNNSSSRKSKGKNKSKTVAGLFLVTIMAVVCHANGATSTRTADSYILATATTGGTYYPVGVALATTIKVKLAPTANIHLSAISSAGSGENLKLLRQNEAQFAILQGLYGAWAWRGEGPFNINNTGKGSADKNLRSITMLWENVEHFVMQKALLDSADISYLKHIGKSRVPFSIGKRNSGTEGSGKYILNQLDIKPNEHFELNYLAYSASVNAIQDSRIKGMNMPGGVPVSAVARVFAAQGKDLVILNFSEEDLQAVNKKYPLWRHYEIAANTYPNQPYAVNTIAQPNFLAVRADVSDEVVYLILQTLYNNLPFLHNIHSATRAMSLARAVKGLPVPLHPGAIRFYSEHGIDIPPDLRANSR